MEEIAGNISITGHIAANILWCWWQNDPPGVQNPPYFWNIHGCPVSNIVYTVCIYRDANIYIYIHIYSYTHTYPTKQHTKKNVVKSQQTLPPYVSTAIYQPDSPGCKSQGPELKRTLGPAGVPPCAGSKQNLCFAEMTKAWVSSWWFQPLWKILVKMDHFPK